MNSALPFRALRRAAFAFAICLSATAGGEDDDGSLSLQQYFRLLPETLAGLPDEFDDDKSPIDDQTPDADCVLDYCAYQQQVALLAADADSDDENSESLKKKARDLWQKLGFCLYSQYLIQAQAQGSLRGIEETTEEAAAKVPAAIGSFRAFANAVENFEKALAGGHRSAIKKAAKQVCSTFSAAETDYKVIVSYHGFPKLLQDDKRTADDFTPTLAKSRELWTTFPADLIQIPGVKEFVAKRIKEIEELEARYRKSYQTLLDACAPCIGSDPAIYSQAGLQVSRHDEVLDYLRKKYREAEAKK